MPRRARRFSVTKSPGDKGESYSGMDNNHTAWIAHGQNSLATTGWIQAFVICGTVS